MALVAEDRRLTLMPPRTRVEHSGQLGPPSIRRTAEKALGDEVVLSGVAPAFLRWAGVRVLRSTKSASTDCAVFTHALVQLTIKSSAACACSIGPRKGEIQPIDLRPRSWDEPPWPVSVVEKYNIPLNAPYRNFRPHRHGRGAGSHPRSLRETSPSRGLISSANNVDRMQGSSLFSRG